MPENQKTFSDFFSKVEEVLKDDIIDANFFVERWVKMVSKERWEEVKAMPLTLELVVTFAEDMVSMYWERISSIETDALYSMAINEGHSFLRNIHKIATELGLETDIRQIDSPLTPSDSLLRSGLATEA